MLCRFEKENSKRVERYQRASFSATAAAQWLNIRLQGLGVLMVTAIALIAVLEHNYHSVDPGIYFISRNFTFCHSKVSVGLEYGH